MNIITPPEFAYTETRRRLDSTGYSFVNLQGSKRRANYKIDITISEISVSANLGVFKSGSYKRLYFCKSDCLQSWSFE